MKTLGQRVLVRLAPGDAEDAVRAVSHLQHRVGGFVVDSGLLLDRGPILVGALCALGPPLLADLGIVERPAVVAGAVARMGKLGARWVSVSGLGGRSAVEAAVAEGRGYPEMSVLVSAALAGWVPDHELKGVGIGVTPGSLVSKMTRLALNAGADGILFPARELGVAAQTGSGDGLGNSESFWRVADATERLSSSEHVMDVAEVIAGGAHRVIVPQGAVGEGEGFRIG